MKLCSAFKMISKTEQNKTTSWISNLCDARYVWKIVVSLWCWMKWSFVLTFTHKHNLTFLFFAKVLKSKTYKCSKIIHQILGLMWLMPDAFIKSTFNHHHRHQHILFFVFKISFFSQFTFDILYVQNTIIIVTQMRDAYGGRSTINNSRNQWVQTSEKWKKKNI